MGKKLQIGIIISGMFMGLIGGISVFASGHPLWQAIAVYSGIGSFTAIAALIIGWIAWVTSEQDEDNFYGSASNTASSQ